MSRKKRNLTHEVRHALVIFKMLGDYSRLMMLNVIHRYGPIKVVDIMTELNKEGLDISRAGVSKQIAVLLNARMIECQVEGKKHLFRIGYRGLKLGIDDAKCFLPWFNDVLSKK